MWSHDKEIRRTSRILKFFILKLIKSFLIMFVFLLILGTIITTIRGYNDKNNNNNTITSNK